MKLWFVLYIFGKVAGSWGPLPYDMAECEVRVAEKKTELDAGFAAHPEPHMLDGKAVKRGDMTVGCLAQEARPANEGFATEGESLPGDPGTAARSKPGG